MCKLDFVVVNAAGTCDAVWKVSGQGIEPRRNVKELYVSEFADAVVNIEENEMISVEKWNSKSSEAVSSVENSPESIEEVKNEKESEVRQES